MVQQAWRRRLEEATRLAIEQLASRYQPQLIILFGSTARGDVHEDSDIDLLVVKQTDRPFFQRIDEALSLLDVKVPVQVLVYTPDELNQLRREGRDFITTILAEGKVVYDARSRQQRSGSLTVAEDRGAGPAGSPVEPTGGVL